MVIRQKKRRDGTVKLFGSSDGSSHEKHEKWLANVVIILVFGLLFFATGTVFPREGVMIQPEKAITGMAVAPGNGSVDYSDKYTVGVQLRNLLRNEVQVIDGNYLSGLEGGSISTDLGSTDYEQYFKFTNLEDDTEQIKHQIKVDYTKHDGEIGDYLYVEDGSLLGDTFIEYGINFEDGLRSSVDEHGYLDDLLGKRVSITADVYEIFNAIREGSGDFIFRLINHEVQDVMYENETETYYVEGVDYTLWVVDIEDSMRPNVTINISSAAIQDRIGAGTTGDYHFLSDGTLVAIGEIKINESSLRGYEDGVRENALFDNPLGIVALFHDFHDYAYVADTENHVIRRIDLANGNVTTIAGDGYAGFSDGVGSDAKFNSPTDIVVEPGWNGLYVADSGNNRIRWIDLDSYNVTTIAGGGADGCIEGNGTEARFRAPKGITGGYYNVTETGQITLFVADEENHVVWRIVYNASGTFSDPNSYSVVNLAGNCTQSGYVDGVGEGARFDEPQDVVFHSEGDKKNPIYVVDANNNVVRKIDNLTKVTTFAGNGTIGWADGKTNVSMFNNPSGISIEGNDVLYVADKENNVVRKIIISDEDVSTFAGEGEPGNLDGDVLSARFNGLEGLVFYDKGIYVADSGNHKVRRISNSLGKVFSVSGGGDDSGDTVEVYLGGSFFEIEDDNINDLEFDPGVLLNGVEVHEAYLRIQGNDSNLSEVVIDSVEYRLAPDSSQGDGIWARINETVSQWLEMTEALIGTFDIFYDGLTTADTSMIEFEPNLENDTYNLMFETTDNKDYDFALLTNYGGVFKYGDNESGIVFREGKINETSTAYEQDFTIGVGDAFEVIGIVHRQEF